MSEMRFFALRASSIAFVVKNSNIALYFRCSGFEERTGQQPNVEIEAPTQYRASRNIGRNYQPRAERAAPSYFPSFVQRVS
jgi:hypothetical protein